MADGTNACTPFRDGSDIVIDYCCYVCEQNGVQKEAAHYCKQCSKCYCDTSVLLHDLMFRTHSLVGRGEMQRWPVANATADILTRCQEHNNQIITLFCDDDNALCCLKCVSEIHKQCSSIRLISEKAKDSVPTELMDITNDIAEDSVATDLMDKTNEVAEDSVPTDLSAITYEIATMIQQINKLQTDRVANIQTLQSSYENILGELVNMRQKINNSLDKLENNTIAKLDLLHTKLFHSINTDINKCMKQTDAMKSLSDIWEEIGEKDESLSFIAHQKMFNELMASDELVKELQKVHVYSMKLDIRQDILQLLSSLSSLGELAQYTPNNVISECLNVTTITATVQKYINECSLRGISACSDDTIFVVDRLNNRIKLINKSGNDICYHDMSILAWDLSQVSLDEFAVTINNDTIHGVEFFLIKDGSISRKMALYFPHRCRGVTHSMGYLYVTSGTALYQYTMTGQLVKKLYEDTSGELTVYKTAVCAGKIYVTNSSHDRLITLSMDGTLLSTLTDPELKDPTDVHVTLAGLVLVCGYTSNTILQIDGDGQRKLKTLATIDTGVQKPCSVYLNLNSKNLIVGQENILTLQLS